MGRALGRYADPWHDEAAGRVDVCRRAPAHAAAAREPFRYYEYGTRIVHMDGCVEVEGAYYRAPPGWLGQSCKVQWDGLRVRLLHPVSETLLREIAVMNNDIFPAQDGAHPVAAYTAITSLVTKFKQSDFIKLAPLLPDVLWLEELIVKRCEEINSKSKPGAVMISNVSGGSTEPWQLLSGYKSSLTIADPFVLPVMPAFCVFIKNGKWVQPLDKLWEKYGAKTVSGVWETYRESGKNSAAVFGRAKASWAATCDLRRPRLSS